MGVYLLVSDLLIRNGHVYDGTGNPWFITDIYIENNVISKVGTGYMGKAERVIDASDLVVCPVRGECDVGGVVIPAGVLAGPTRFDRRGRSGRHRYSHRAAALGIEAHSVVSRGVVGAKEPGRVVDGHAHAGSPIGEAVARGSSRVAAVVRSLSGW